MNKTITFVMMEKEEVVFKNEKFSWYSFCLLTIGCLVAGLVLNSVKILFLLPLLLYFCILEYKHLNRCLILNKDGFTDENGSFYAWKSIDHCYIKDEYSRDFIIIFKDKDEPKISVSLNNYHFKNRELEDAVDRFAGKSLIRYTYEDKKVEKKEDKETRRLLLKFFLIVIGVLLLIALFSFYYSRIDN
jgi:hypothetical protein